MKQRGRMTYAPLYFEDFKKGCEDLTNEQIGAYLRILFEIYEAMGPIEFDERKLGKRLNSRPHKARAMVETLIFAGKLFLTPTGQISNHRAEDEILKFVSISVQNQLNGSSPKLTGNSPPKKPNDFKGTGKRPLSGSETILDKKNITTSSFEGSACHPREPLPDAERSKRALEEFHKRKRQRQVKTH